MDTENIEDNAAWKADSDTGDTARDSPGKGKRAEGIRVMGGTALPPSDFNTLVFALGCGSAAVVFTMALFGRVLLLWLHVQSPVIYIASGVVLMLGMVCSILGIFVFLMGQLRFIYDDVCKR